MNATLEAFPEPVALVNGDLSLREANAAWRAQIPAAAAAALPPKVADAARAVIEGRLPRAEIDAPEHRWTVVPVAGVERLALVHARALPAARERALAEENQLLRVALDSIPSLVFVKNRSGRFVLSNKAHAAVHRLTPEQVIARSQGEVHRNDAETEGYLRVDRQVIDGGQPITIRETTTRADGKVRWMETTKMPLVRSSGEVQVLGFCLDITERLRAEEARDEAVHALEAAAEEARREAEEKAALAAELDRRLALIEAQHRQILELSAPILDIGEDVIGVPLIGAMDEERAARLTERLLGVITARRIRQVILDLTAIEAVDPRAADRLIGIVRAIGLLGARAVITGIQPAVAQAMVALGVELGGIATMRAPRDALRAGQPSSPPEPSRSYSPASKRRPDQA